MGERRQRLRIERALVLRARAGMAARATQINDAASVRYDIRLLLPDPAGGLRGLNDARIEKPRKNSGGA